jgi:hypothetical protein
MARGPSEQLIRGHITAISRWTRSDVQLLTEALMRRSWPDGGGDRCAAPAQVKLRHSQPTDQLPNVNVCACSAGRCLICN